MGCGGFGSVAEAAVVSIEGGETIGVAATPLDEQDGRVVAGDTASFLFQGVGRAHPGAPPCGHGRLGRSTR